MSVSVCKTCWAEVSTKDEDAHSAWHKTYHRDAAEFSRADRVLDEEASVALDDAASGYEELRRVYDKAVEQASAGKGHERHATGDDPFHEQQIVRLSKWLGSNHFNIGQACKKAVESTRLPKERAIAELLGAMNYLAAAVLVLEGGE